MHILLQNTFNVLENLFLDPYRHSECHFDDRSIVELHRGQFLNYFLDFDHNFILEVVGIRYLGRHSRNYDVVIWVIFETGWRFGVLIKSSSVPDSRFGSVIGTNLGTLPGQVQSHFEVWFRTIYHWMRLLTMKIALRAFSCFILQRIFKRSTNMCIFEYVMFFKFCPDPWSGHG